MSDPSKTSNVEEETKCPVDHQSREVWLKQMHQPKYSSQTELEEKKCPVDHDSRDVWLQKTAPLHTEEAIECSSEQLPITPVYKTDAKLPENRDISSIPRTGSGSNWVYPSEKQFYEAMIRKKWDPNSDDMKTVVPLHNSVNERVWNYIKLWENGQGGDSCGGIQLTSFKGDSKKLTPRAWFRSVFLGYAKPFDRHDWSVNRCGTKIDYVIDFYNEDNDITGPSIYLDVRPKLNTLEGFKLRFLKALGFQN